MTLRELIREFRNAEGVSTDGGFAALSPQHKQLLGDLKGFGVLKDEVPGKDLENFRLRFSEIKGTGTGLKKDSPEGSIGLF